jgi:hypothetical protein
VAAVPERTSEYFEDPMTALAHALLMVPAFRRDPPAVARKLGITKERLDATLKILARAGLVSLTPQGLEVRTESLHLPKASPLAAYHGSFFRMRGIEALQRQTDEHGYFFTTTFAASNAVRERIRLAFLGLLRDASAWVTEAPEEDAFQLSFDLFRY